MSNALEKAHEAVSERGRVYGHPADDFGKTAKMWEPILGVEVTPEQVALCMVAVKMSRLCQQRDHWHEDSVVDACGYLACLEKVHDKLRKDDAAF